MSEVAVVDRPRREIANVIDPIPTLDTSRFEHMQRIANVMARSTMIPETLRTVGTRDNKVDLPPEQVMANCFLVVNQAVRWGMDPFAVVSCCSVVHGRLSYEGKLVAAVLDAKLGVELHHHFTGDPTSEAYRIYILDQPFTPEIIGQLRPGVSIPGLRLWDGSVAEWKTTGAGTPWTQKNYKRMLIYRGSRDWTRIYESAIMLGVYTEDELIELADDARARRAAPVVSLAERLAIGKATQDSQNGFSEAHVTQELRPKADEAPAHADAGATGDASAPPNSSQRPRLPAASEAAMKPASEPEAGEASPSDAGNLDSSPSSSAPQPPETEAKPAPQVDSESAQGAGTLKSSAGDTTAGEERPTTEPGNHALDGSAGLPDLPQDWPRQYVLALSAAGTPGKLSRFAANFWIGFGGWERIKATEHRELAEKIYDCFKENFGEARRVDRDAALAKLGAL